MTDKRLNLQFWVLAVGIAALSVNHIHLPLSITSACLGQARDKVFGIALVDWTSTLPQRASSDPRIPQDHLSLSLSYSHITSLSIFTRPFSSVPSRSLAPVKAFVKVTSTATAPPLFAQNARSLRKVSSAA